LIFHITARADWSAALGDGVYLLSTRGKSLEQQGFIHCSDSHQVARIANAIYSGASDLVVLTIAVERLSAEVRYENLGGGGELYPHIYGPLPVAAVTSVEPLSPDSDGTFHFRG